jgi:hypothetical protein
MTSRQASTQALAVLAVVAAGFLWSCGGSHESPTAPVAVQTVQDAGDESGGVTSSGLRKITICHKGQTQKVALAALFAHLRHHDRLGACAAAAACPCFDAAGIAEMAAAYPSIVGACSKTDPYLLTLEFASPGGETGGSVGTFEARVGAGACTAISQDPETWEEMTTTLPVTQAQFKACKQAIIGSSYYSADCPR